MSAYILDYYGYGFFRGFLMVIIVVYLYCQRYIVKDIYLKI